jgi:hypothetical protein
MLSIFSIETFCYNLYFQHYCHDLGVNFLKALIWSKVPKDLNFI